MAKLIYTGETDRARGLSRFQVFEDLPEHLAALLAENPALKTRFVNFSDFARRRPPGARIRRMKPTPVAETRSAPPIRPASLTQR